MAVHRTFSRNWIFRSGFWISGINWQNGLTTSRNLIPMMMVKRPDSCYQKENQNDVRSWMGAIATLLNRHQSQAISLSHVHKRLVQWIPISYTNATLQYDEKQSWRRTISNCITMLIQEASSEGGRSCLSKILFTEQILHHQCTLDKKKNWLILKMSYLSVGTSNCTMIWMKIFVKLLKLKRKEKKMFSLANLITSFSQLHTQWSSSLKVIA